MNELAALAPTILSFLGGPAGGLAGAGLQWLAAKFGAKDSTVDAIKEALNGTKPEDVIALRKLDIEFQQFCMENAIRVDLAQIAVNAEEAKSSSMFVAGGRPACIWIGAVALGYASIAEPLMRFAAKVWFGYEGEFPVIDTTVTMQVLFGLLGLGAMRSYDKKQGTA